MIDEFIHDNKENVIDVICSSATDDELAELKKACAGVIEYRKLHYSNFRDEISDLLQVVREFVENLTE